MIPSFIQNSLDSCFDECKIIPMNWHATKFYSVKFEGCDKMQISCDDSNLNSIILIARYTLEGIISCYKGTHAFTEPQISFRPDNIIWELKIGMMENELYNKLIEKKNKDNDLFENLVKKNYNKSF